MYEVEIVTWSVCVLSAGWWICIESDRPEVCVSVLADPFGTFDRHSWIHVKLHWRGTLRYNVMMRSLAFPLAFSCRYVCGLAFKNES